MSNSLSRLIVSRKKNTQLTGAGFWIIRNNKTIVEQSLNLGTIATINQGEIIAIQRAADLLYDVNTKNQLINFYSDSLSSLHQLKKGHSTPKLTIETSVTLNKFSKLNQVTLYKVAAHSSIGGNDKADALAKAEASSPPVGPETFLSTHSVYTLQPSNYTLLLSIYTPLP